MAEPGMAGFDDVRRFAEGLTEQQLFCRENRHRFDIPYSATYEPQYRVFAETRRCACGVEEYKEINRDTGLVETRRLNYSEADGYLMRGMGRASTEGNGAIRLEVRMRRYGMKVIAAADQRYQRQREREQAEAEGKD